ncbi:MAG: ATP-binding protein [Gammaproteobacteria bacterium]|nr:ATP-binding protein [Gammaproteobacteria bacterium]
MTPSAKENKETPSIAHRAAAICLHNMHFKFKDVPRNHHKKHEPDLFVGREVIIKKLVKLLHQTKSSRGCYLIAGYRGVGKTSVVDRTIKQYQNPNSNEETDHTPHSVVTKIQQFLVSMYLKLFFSRPKKVIRIPVNLGENKRLTPEDIYFTIANILHERVSSYIEVRHVIFSYFFVLTAIASLLLLILPFAHHFKLSTLSLYLGTHGLFSLSKNIFNSPPYYYMFIFFVFMLSTSLWCSGKRYKNMILERLETLVLRMRYNIEEQKQFSARKSWFSVGKSRTLKSLPLQAREVEYELTQILESLRKPSLLSADIIFIFDEIDKLSEHSLYENESDRKTSNANSKLNSSEKLNRINDLFGSIKYFITTAHARFFIITGRETLDSYYSEKGSANSLYESLFDQVFEIPSLLTDPIDSSGDANQNSADSKLRLTRRIEEYVCVRLGNNNASEPKPVRSLNEYYRALITKASNDQEKTKTARATVHVLRNFIYYLAFHSWGNPKRLAAIFANFTYPSKPDENLNPIAIHVNDDDNTEEKYWLYFSFDQQRSFILAGNIFTLFQHQLSREVSRIGDKLTVSALSSLQFILKLHPFGFTRESLFRMSEAINIHRAPELNVIVDDLLSHVFKSYIRRVRNGTYRYRFNEGFEQELRYITHVSDLESASYNFSLDAMNRVKNHFDNDLVIAKEQACNSIAIKAHITLGDMNAIEQSYNAASRHYSSAIGMLTSMIKNETGYLEKPGAARISPHALRWSEIELIMLYAEAMLKYGDLEEHRQNYNKAAGIYTQANQVIEDVYLNKSEKENNDDPVKSGDSKWDIIKQTYWANEFLSLKRSPSTISLPNGDQDSVDDTKKPPPILFHENDPRFYFRRANLSFYLGWSELNNAIIDYAKAIFYSRKMLSLPTEQLPNERRDYLEASALVAIVEATLTQKAVIFLENVASKDCQEENSDTASLYRFLKAELYEFIKTENFTPTNFKISNNQNSDEKKKRLHDYFKGQFEGPDNFTLVDFLEKAAQLYDDNNLYISSTLTNIKIISYLYMLLDCFTKEYFENSSKDFNKALLDSIFSTIDKATVNAIKSIGLARQVESSQFIKTLVIRDFKLESNQKNNDDNLLPQLFDLLDPNATHGAQAFPSEDEIFWQHSIWGNKLVSVLYWGDYIRSKIGHEYKSKFKNEFNPSTLPTLSIRSSILMRWVYARKLFSTEIDKKFYENTIQRAGQPAALSTLGKEFIDKLTCFDSEANTDTWVTAYKIARTLYFVLLDIRLISRKNLDLIFPIMTQVLYVYWRLLTYIIKVIVDNAAEKKDNGSSDDITSIRDASILVQSKFLDLERKYGGGETIAPSHFDFEYIAVKIQVLLKEAVSLVDQTSRIRTNILQQKYFAHDDHSDPEFRMDWTLANMIAPSAKCMLANVNQSYAKIKATLDTINESRNNSEKS